MLGGRWCCLGSVLQPLGGNQSPHWWLPDQKYFLQEVPMKRIALGCASLVAIIATTPSLASPISLSGPFEFLDNRSANDAGLATGALIQFGENSVVPNATGGTTATATNG